MKVYVVLFHEEGCSTWVERVFSSRNEAMAFAENSAEELLDTEVNLRADEGCKLYLERREGEDIFSIARSGEDETTAEKCVTVVEADLEGSPLVALAEQSE